MTTHRARITLGMIGCGWVTQTWHLPALRGLSDAEVVAVADCDARQARLAAERFHIPHRYETAAALLKHPGLDAVAVCVPPQHHVEIALAALKTDKHVLIEKPMALSLDGCDALAERAKETSALVMVGFNLRWHRLVRQARTDLHNGALGRLSMIRAAFTNGVYRDTGLPAWRRHRAFGGGVLQDMAVHHFDLWRFLLESEIEEILVIAQPGSWEDETAAVTARMANGVLISAAYSARTTDNHEMEFYGETGRLRLSCYRFDGLERHPLSRSSGGMAARVSRLASRVRDVPHAWSAVRHGGEMLASYRAQWRHFIACIQQRIPVECTVEDGWRAVQAALAAIESASSKRPVTLRR